ncbi:MAG: hypothetical protein P8Y68_14415, partial [Anaerolineales bacterium]
IDGRRRHDHDDAAIFRSVRQRIGTGSTHPGSGQGWVGKARDPSLAISSERLVALAPAGKSKQCNQIAEAPTIPE